MVRDQYAPVRGGAVLGARHLLAPFAKPNSVPRSPVGVDAGINRIFQKGKQRVVTGRFPLHSAARAKKELQLDASLYTLLQILSVNIFEKMPLHQALSENALPSNNIVNPNRLNLLGV